MVSVIMTFTKVENIKAELAQNGIINGDAKPYYENAVKAAIEQWGAVVLADYFLKPAVTFNGTNNATKIFGLVNNYQHLFEYR